MSGKLIWITGLSGSGKTTLAKLLFARLKELDRATIHIDGDDFREIFGNDLGHDPEDRLINAYRIARMCSFITSQHINVICSTMSLYKEIHNYNREHNQKYFEVFLDVDKEQLVSRDPKGLYKKALNGEVSNIVGINLDFDFPSNCDLILNNHNDADINQNISRILTEISNKFNSI